jgi:integrase
MKAWVRQKAAEVKRRGKKKAGWYVHWKEPDGTRRSRSCGWGARAKQEANKLAADIHSSLLAGTYVTDPSLTSWSAFISEYRRVEIRKKQGVHAGYINNTIATFERHMKPRTMKQITTKYIGEFIGKRSEDRGYKFGSKISPSTVNKDLRNLKLILKMAHEWGQLEKMPKIQMVKAPRRIKRHVLVEHFAAMFAAAEQMTVPELPNVTPCEYWRALISFAFITGWRINEVLNIRRDDVDYETGQVVARWDDSKGKRDEMIFVPESLLDLLRPVWQNFADRPLEWKKSRRTLYVPFTELQTLAGIDLHCEEDHQHTKACHVYGFHDFKRAFATNNASTLSSAQLQRLMKHSEFSTTQGYIDYAKVMTERPNVFVPDVLTGGPGKQAGSR